MCVHLHCHFIRNHIRIVCLAVSSHLHFWHNDWALLRATMVAHLRIVDALKPACYYYYYKLPVTFFHQKGAMGSVRYAVTAVVVAYVTFAFFRYLDTHVPEGVPEVWHARILDASLRTTGSVVSICSLSSLHPAPTPLSPPPTPHPPHHLLPMAWCCRWLLLSICMYCVCVRSIWNLRRFFVQ